MFELKSIASASIERALAKAERYRLLNEPREAESICRDVLRTDEGNQPATVMLLLALTDQFGRIPGVRMEHARELLPAIGDPYAQAYYAGVIAERWAKAQLESGDPGHVIYDRFRDAMGLYEQALRLAPDGNEDAALRWNTCARIIEANAALRPKPEDEPYEHAFSDL